jgi:hypothetical protein
MTPATLPGVGGTLFPTRFLQEALPLDALPGDDLWIARRRAELLAWWQRIERQCGPATGLHGLFDLVAMPLAAMLGFRARGAIFEAGQVRAMLVTRQQRSLALIVRPWASGQPALWRGAAMWAHEVGSGWCVLIAPPYVSVVDARGHGGRRSLDFRLPNALEPASVVRLLALAGARAFDGDPSRLDRLVAAGMLFQDRVREDLQRGVTDALSALTASPQSAAGRSPRHPASRFDEALTLVYRILFLLFAESRDLVPHRHPVYGRAYRIGALCHDALASTGPGSWDALAAVTRLLRVGCRMPDLVVRPFNGELFARRAAPALETPQRSTSLADRRDAAMRRALVALGTRPGRAGREMIQYADLGVEQLGAVYERVLDIDPADVELPRAGARHSHRRKASGTFYTPQPLAEFVVRRTLAPLVAGVPSDAILALRVVDPAMGSGAFLVAACRYLADAYGRALVDEGRISAGDIDDDIRADHRRLVAERCLSGVDANPVAVHLARLSLWLASLARGKPLGFLDHRLRVGDSLIGAVPADLWRIRDRHARAPIDAPLPLFEAAGLQVAMSAAAAPIQAILARADDTVDDVRSKTEMWREIVSPRSPLEPWRLALSLWCARWFWPDEGGGTSTRTSAPGPAELRAIVDAVVKGDRTLGDRVAAFTAVARSVAESRRFFHWPLEFPDVFRESADAGAPRPGFDAVIGNPPWEMLRRDGPADDDRSAIQKFIRHSGHFPRSSHGHVNVYLPFVEKALAITKPTGRIGLVLPWSFAVDDGAAAMRSAMIDAERIESIVGLDNAAGLFPIHRGLRFLVLVAGASTRGRSMTLRCGVRTAAEIEQLPDRDVIMEAPAIRLDRGRLARLGSRTRRIPDVRDPRDLELLERLTTTFPAIGDAGGYRAQFSRDFNATDDRARFGSTGVPVVEGKHLAPFTVDLAGVEHRITRAAAEARLSDRRFLRPRLAYRDVSGVSNRTTLIAAILPAAVVSTHTVFCLRTPLAAELQHFLCALFNSYVLNAVARMLMGGHLTTSLIESLPAPPWTGSARESRIASMAAILSAAPSPDVEAGLQAEVAAIYGLGRDELARVLDGFPLVDRQARDAALNRFAL